MTLKPCWGEKMICSGIVVEETLGEFETVFLPSLVQGCHRTLSE